MTKVLVGDITGPQGPQGPQGAPGQDGVDGLPGPQGEPGAPGVNAVENDTAVAAYIGTPGSQTRNQLDATFSPKGAAGLLSARPAASSDNADQLYFATDVRGGTLYRSTGTSWAQVAAPVAAGVDQPLWIDAQRFTSPQTGPALSYTGTGGNRTSVWLLDAATSERLYTTAFIPSSWESVDLTLYWSHNDAAPSGDARFRVYYTDLDETATLNAQTGSVAGVVDTAPAQYWLSTVTLATGLELEPGQPVKFVVERMADDVLDTFASDVGVIGLMIARSV